MKIHSSRTWSDVFGDEDVVSESDGDNACGVDADDVATTGDVDDSTRAVDIECCGVSFTRDTTDRCALNGVSGATQSSTCCTALFGTYNILKNI